MVTIAPAVPLRIAVVLLLVSCSLLVAGECTPLEGRSITLHTVVQSGLHCHITVMVVKMSLRQSIASF